jgi:23S rRNA (guanosine2251-2'-O)-methyltransferase
MDPLPYLVKPAAAPYEGLRPLPVTVVAENFRSLYNVGALFRTADGAGIERLVLAGITGRPPDRGISKTALGAEERVAWEYCPTAVEALDRLRAQGYEIAAIETDLHAVDLFDWSPRFPVCVVLGNELEGVSPEALARSDVRVEIPMLGLKHSLNVATAAGVVLYELLRKYRRAHERGAAGAGARELRGFGRRRRG